MGDHRYQVFAITLIAAFSCWIDASPLIVSPPETLRVFEGQTVILRCRVQGVPQNDVDLISWSSVSKNLVIFEGNQLMTDDVVKYTLINVPEGINYNLQILDVHKSDQGFYKCAIAGTNQTMITLLDVIGVPHIALPEGDPVNVTDCCLLEKLDESCLPACYPDGVDLDNFDVMTNCGSVRSLEILSECFTAGSNHDNCCLFSEVDPLCVDFCHNSIPDTLTVDHLNKCLDSKTINSIFNCFAMGFEYLPSEPTGVFALAFPREILVNWAPPQKNADVVTGYKIMYKPVDKETYYTVIRHNPHLRQYRIHGKAGTDSQIKPNTGYTIRVAALADYGVSFGSIEIDTYTSDDAMVEKQDKDIYECCADRNVNGTCRNLLCRTKTWSHFDMDHVIGCLPYISDVFTCLAGEQDHTPCCQLYSVQPACLPMCSGKPPHFDASILHCVNQMDVIEGCVQQGYSYLPKPPSQLILESVEPASAIIRFIPSKSQMVNTYVVELRTGSESEPFRIKSRLNATATVVVLDDLKSNTYYWVRIIAETVEAASLPSETVGFLTYPDDYFEPTPPPVTNLAQNLTECCKETGMPEVCWRGCEYQPNITAYYANHLDICYSHIGTVLACASDGRDHSDCCRRRNAQDVCIGLCAHTQKGPLDSKYLACIGDTAKAVMCYIEGIVNLPRHPDVVVTEASKNSISLKWEQPKTSGRIDLYIIEYGISEAEKMNVSTDKTSYILQNLLPGNPYEITVTSQNENGTSAPSPAIIQYTNSEDIDSLYYNRTFDVQEGRALWENITHCCTDSVSSQCMDQCLNKYSASIPKPECIDESHNMLACFSNGQDHRVCCEEKNLPSVCVPLCAGHTRVSDYSLATCMSYAHRDIILSCFLENSGLIPEPPKLFSMSRTAWNTVQLRWFAPKYCGGDCFYTLHFWTKDQRSNAQTRKNITSGYLFQVPTEGEMYQLTLTASNSYGSSPPSATLNVPISSTDIDVKIYLKAQDWFAEKGGRALLFCSYTGFEGREVEINWFYFGRRQLYNTGDNRLENAGQQNLIIDNVSKTDEGNYTCTVSTPGFPPVSDTLFLAVKREPENDRINVESKRPNQGLQGKVACWFYGLPDSVPENWVHDGVTVVEDLSKYSMNRDERRHTGVTSYRLKISNMTNSDYGEYSISVMNSYGRSKCQVTLTNPDDDIDLITPSKEADPVGCCVNKGVSGLCRNLCGFHVNVSEIINDITYLECLQHFEDLIECGADGRDHSKCCQNQGVKPYCLPLCKGVVPGDVQTERDKLVECVLESAAIFQCAQRGHTLIPYAPEDVRLTLRDSGTTVLVVWNKPTYNQGKVHHYNIYYNTSLEPKVQPAFVDESATQYRIHPAVQGVTYYVWMTAGSKHGVSLTTEPVSIPVPITAEDKGPHDLKAERVPNSPDIHLTWEMVNASKYTGYTLYYKMLNAARYSNIPGIETKFYRLTGLEPDTSYQAYVVATGSESNSPPSENIGFTTGSSGMLTSTPRGGLGGGTAEKSSSSGMLTSTPRGGLGGGTAEKSKSDDSDSKKVAIGVGVTIAIIALIAIIFLVLFFVYRRRAFRPSAGEAVTFENPGYGNQEQVKIQGVDERFNYGRLREDGTAGDPSVYSNPDAGESSIDPGLENPAYDNVQPPNTAATLHVETGS